MGDKEINYSLEEIIDEGVDFGDLWYSSSSDEVLDNAEDENGSPFNGIAYETYANGMLRYFSIYKNGFQHGLTHEFYESGKTKSKQLMERGQIIGKKISWNENGEIKSIGEYENGIELNYQEWDENGNLAVSRVLSEISDNYKLLNLRREQRKNEQTDLN